MSSFGFILNNQMMDFNIEGAESDPVLSNPNNLIKPGKRPVSSMTPTLIHSRNRPCGLRVALGGINGTRIISGVAQVRVSPFYYGYFCVCSEKGTLGADTYLFFFFLSFIYFTSFGEKDKADMNSLRWSARVGLEPAYTRMWVARSTTVLPLSTVLSKLVMWAKRGSKWV